jgi:hypothetical protein
MNVILNNILVEWSYRVSNGTPNPSNEEHLLILRDIILEKGINEKDVNSFIYRIKNGRVVLGEAKFLKNIVSKLKRVWTSLKSKIKSLFSKKLKGLGPGQETIITIPGLKTENRIEYMNLKDLLNEGALQAIKGNYNEALTCQYIYKNDGKKGVGITKKYKPIKSQVDGVVKKWDTDLKNAVSNYAAAKKIIETGSKDMARYLIGSVINEDAIIIGAYLDNLAFQGGVEFKADIQVAIMKEGKQRLDAYSLKLYSGKSVGLANSSPVGLARHLAGETAAKKVETAIVNNKKLQELIIKAKEANKKKQTAKKTGDKKEEKKWFDKRHEARKPINPMLAKITYEVLKPYAKTPSFGENILKMLGFADKDTKMLMAITTDKKSIIMDKHPDLDISNIDLRLKGVQILVVGPKGKTIVNFGVKEGEQKKLSGKVSFASVEPVDLANYPTFEEN